MKILFLNHFGSGFAQNVDVPEGTTVGTLFCQQVHGKASDFLIRVNREHCSADQVLRDNDRVTVTALKIEGAL